MSQLTGIVTAADPAHRNRSLDAYCRAVTLADLQSESAALDRFRRSSDNLYERVRALFFLYAIHRFHLPFKSGVRAQAPIPFSGYDHLLKRRFEEAIEILPGGASRERLQCGHLQRAGRGVSRARLPNARRTGAPQRAQRARQSVDVPHRPPRRLSTAHPPRASAPDRRPLPHPARDHAGPHGPDPQRLERHFFPGHGFSGRRARAECLDRPSRARTPARPSRPWKPGCA